MTYDLRAVNNICKFYALINLITTSPFHDSSKKVDYFQELMHDPDYTSLEFSLQYNKPRTLHKKVGILIISSVPF